MKTEANRQWGDRGQTSKPKNPNNEFCNRERVGYRPHKEQVAQAGYPGRLEAAPRDERPEC